MPSDHPFDDVDLRAQPERYRIGRGEYGVFHAEPYTSELQPLWRFKNPEVAREAAEAIWAKYEAYRDDEDFPGMDVARKFLQMGYTRARRYAKHPDGRKYDADGTERPVGEEDAEKAEAARIFKRYWDRVREDDAYQRLKDEWKEQYA